MAHHLPRRRSGRTVIARTGFAFGSAFAVSLAATAASAQTPAADPINTLYMELNCGRVVIEMRPDLAPRTVNQIRGLVRDGFYDGLLFFYVDPGQVVMTGDPFNLGIASSDYPDLPTEASDEPFVRGSVGMLRPPDNDEHENSQFFILLAADPILDGAYTNWGQVVEGMECVDQIERTPYTAWWITTLRVAADVN